MFSCLMYFSKSGATVIKLFESHNILKCKNYLHDLLETCVYLIIFDNMITFLKDRNYCSKMFITFKYILKHHKICIVRH